MCQSSKMFQPCFFQQHPSPSLLFRILALLAQRSELRERGNHFCINDVIRQSLDACLMVLGVS